MPMQRSHARPSRVMFGPSAGARRFMSSRSARHASDANALLPAQPATVLSLMSALSTTSPTPAAASFTSLTAQGPASEIDSPVNVLERELKEVERKLVSYSERVTTLLEIRERTRWTPVKHPRIMLHQRQEIVLVRKLQMAQQQKRRDVEAAKSDALRQQHDAELGELFDMEE